MAAVKIHVPVDGAGYDVTIGPGVRSQVAGAVRQHDRVAVLSDARVLVLYGKLAGLEEASLKSLPGGEDIKTLAVLETVLDFCSASSLARSSAIVAFGGGTVGDLGGLAASLYKRGLDVIQVPTTLLAQVDASVGGKTAVNLSSGKNLAGTFHQPAAVFCDTDLLSTLDENEYQSGLGEVIKTALIGGHDELARLASSASALRNRETETLTHVVADCVATKARVVASDPTERGARRSLNLGHTFAHAIEHAAGYGRVPHGIAVGVGLGLAARASEQAGLAADSSLAARVAALLDVFGLPQSLADLRARYDLQDTLSIPRLIEGLGHDKKGRVGAPEFVLMRGPGDIVLGERIERSAIEALFR